MIDKLQQDIIDAAIKWRESWIGDPLNKIDYTKINCDCEACKLCRLVDTYINEIHKREAK